MQTQAVDPFGIVGQVLDAQFRVDRLVGEGGFSAVYRGHHLGLEEPIAIKCLKLPPSLSPQLVDQFSKRFRDESRILYRLSLGNLDIVRSIAAGTWQASTGAFVPYMILEWMEGRSLANDFTIRRTVGQQGRSLEEVIKLFGSAADGLGHAHTQGVVHRDLNPGNLFLASTPQGVRMKVLDFGVAKILDESTLDIARTQTVGQIRIFAPAYGAPEQFDDTIGPVGAASDVYAFALILLEAMRDRCVNDGKHLGEFAEKAIDPNRRPTPRMFGLDVTDEIEQIFARATRLDPRERWQSAGELWQAFTIAARASSQERHSRAAMETPPLAMPGQRSTKKGIAPPPEPGKAPGVPRLDRTLPLATAMPRLNLPRPSGEAAPSPAATSERGPSSLRIPTAPGVPRQPAPSSSRVPSRPSTADAAQVSGSANPSTQRLPKDIPASIEDDRQLPLYDVASTDDDEEAEDEVTRVRAPEPDVLRGLADIDARSRAAAMKTTQLSRGTTPRPAAGMAPGGSSSPPNVAPAPPLVPPESSPASGGTLMMGPGYGHHPSLLSHPTQSQVHGLSLPDPRSPSGQHKLGQTMPLAGPHPLGMQGQAPGTAPPPAAGAPPPQPPYPLPNYPHQHQHQQPMLQPAPHLSVQTQGPAFAQAQHGSRMGDSVSMPPGSVVGIPKKNNTLLYAAIAMASLAVIGLVLAAIVVVGGKGDGGKGASSATASASIPIASAPPPPPPPVIDPVPLVDVVPDASDSASDPAQTEEDADAGTAAVDPAPTATATATATSTAADVVPVPVPVAVKDAGPPPDPNAFNEPMARSRLGQANGILVFCKKEGGVTGPGTATVTFATDGTVSAVTMDPPYSGTPAGDCVTGHFKRTKISAFQGSSQTLKHTFEVPK